MNCSVYWLKSRYVPTDGQTDRLHSKLVSKHHFVNKLLISFENDAVVVVGRRSGALLFTQIVGH